MVFEFITNNINIEPQSIRKHFFESSEIRFEESLTLVLKFKYKLMNVYMYDLYHVMDIELYIKVFAQIS